MSKFTIAEYDSTPEDRLHIAQTENSYHVVSMELDKSWLVNDILIAGNNVDIADGKITSRRWSIENPLFPSLLVEAPPWYTPPEGNR